MVEYKISKYKYDKGWRAVERVKILILKAKFWFWKQILGLKKKFFKIF